MGCGKSSTGRALAGRLKARFVDLDEEIVARAGRSIPEIFRDGEDAFRTVELETLRAVLDAADAAQGDTVLALGGGALTLPAARELIFRICPKVSRVSRLSLPICSMASLSGCRSPSASTTSKAKLNLSVFLKRMPLSTSLYLDHACFSAPVYAMYCCRVTVMKSGASTCVVR